MEVSFDVARRLAELSGLVLTAKDQQSALTAVSETATAVVAQCDGTSMTMRRDGHPTASSADGEWAIALDRAQVEEAEGPCLDCMRLGAVMRVRDLASDTRWPSYGPRAAQLGARSTVSFPMAAEGRTVGALNLYSREPDAFDARAVAVGELLAAHASLALQAATAFHSSQELAEGLRTAMESRAHIEQAKGVIMARERCGEDAAFEALSRASQAANVPLREIAARLVAEASGAEAGAGAAT